MSEGMGGLIFNMLLSLAVAGTGGVTLPEPAQVCREELQIRPGPSQEVMFLYESRRVCR